MYSANGSKRQQSENSHYNDIHAKTTSFFWTIFSSISRWTVISSIALMLVIIMFSISIIAFTHSPKFDKQDLLYWL